MKIKGLIKTTFIDYPEKIACTIFLFGCNFKCGFCHNPELVIYENSQEYSKEEVLEFLKSRKKYLDAVCFTGGEPLLTLEKAFVKQIKDLGYLIKIDTNGTNPEKLKEFINDGLIDFVAMDIKGDKENYNFFTGVKTEIEKIEQSIKLISSLENYEFRTTVLEEFHSKENIIKMFSWINQLINKKINQFSFQGFKHETKHIDLNFSAKKDTSEIYLNELKDLAKDYCEKVEIRV
jgi:pyruvate formate lyase activating enzyme